MLIIRTSNLTGKNNMREIPIDHARYVGYLERRKLGTARLIQDEFPDLSRDDREFILTGTTPEEWDAAFKE